MRGACYKCEFMGEITGSAYVYCKNKKAVVEGDKYGIKNGWFDWPFSFDPVWLIKCDGFKRKEE